MPDRVAWLVESLLLLLILFAPLPLGGKPPWAVFAMSAGAFVLLSICLLSLKRDHGARCFRVSESVSLPAWRLIPFAIVLLVLLLQLAPIPFSVAKSLVPARATLAGLSGASPSFVMLSVYPFATVKTLVFWAGCFSILLTAYFCIESRMAARIFGWTLVLSGTFQALYGMIEFLSGRQYIFHIQKVYYLVSATGTFVNRNHYACYLALCFCVLWGLLRHYFSKGSSGKNRPPGYLERSGLLFSLGILIATAIVFSGSRGGAVSLLLALVLFQGIFPILKGRWQAPMMIAALVAGIFLFVFWIGRAPLAGRVKDLPSEISTMNHRTGAWKTSLAMIADAPVLGGGGGTFSYRYPMYRTHPGGMNFIHAHSDVLEWFTDTGVVGGTAFYLGLFLLVVFVFKRSRSRHSSLSMNYALGGMMAVSAVMVHQVFDFPLQMPGIAFTLCAVLGWTCAVATKRLE